MKLRGKRSSVPKTWAIPRKGTTFIIKGNEKSLPLVIGLRDLLKYAQNRREVKKAIHNKDLMISNKLIKDDKTLLELFDILTIVPSKKYFKLTFSEKGKFILEEVQEKDTKTKISKIIGKKVLSGNKIQINLLDSRNYICDLSCKVGDSAIIDLEKNKIIKILPVKEKSEVLVIGGKHIGEKGKITKISDELKLAEIDSGKEKFNVLIKQLVAVN